MGEPKVDLFEWAQTYLKFSSLVPLVPGEKVPLLKDWPSSSLSSLEEVKEALKSGKVGGWGLFTGEALLILDVDLKNPGAEQSAHKIKEELLARGLDWDSIPRVRTPSGGFHLYFKGVSGIGGRRRPRKLRGIEFLSGKSFAVAPPSEFKGVPYRWEVPLPEDPSALPEFPRDLLAYYLPGVEEAPREESPSAIGGEFFSFLPIEDPQSALRVLCSLLESAWVEGNRHNLALGLAGVLWKAGIPWETSSTVMRELCSALGDPEVEDRLKTLSSTYSKWPSEVAGVELLSQVLSPVEASRVAGWVLIYAMLLQYPGLRVPSVGEILVGARGSELDESLFYRFLLGAAKRRIAYHPGKKEFFFLTPEGWRPRGKDLPKSVVSELWEVLRAFASFVGKALLPSKFGEFLLAEAQKMSLARASRLVSLLKEVELFTVPDREWNKDPFLIQAKNGVVDLRTGELLPFGPYLTASIPHTYIPWEELPEEDRREWEEVVNSFWEDPAQVEWIQRFLGYALTGKREKQSVGPWEKVLTLFWGPADSGKTTFSAIITEALGPEVVYHLPSASVLKGRGLGGEGPTPFLRRMMGARLVVVNEVDPTGDLNDSLVKLLTGGDPLTARGLHEEPVTFYPSWTIIFLSNVRPTPRSDSALWTRLRLVPFPFQFVPHPKGGAQRKKDPHLFLKIKPHVVFSWIVEGARKYYEGGLPGGEDELDLLPPRMREAHYSLHMDSPSIDDFVQEVLVPDPEAVLPANKLYQAYELYCRENASNPESRRMVREKLRFRFGSDYTRAAQGMVLKGYRLSDFWEDKLKEELLARGGNSSRESEGPPLNLRLRVIGDRGPLDVPS